MFMARTFSLYLMVGNNSEDTAPLSPQDVIGLVKGSSET